MCARERAHHAGTCLFGISSSWTVNDVGRGRDSVGKIRVPIEAPVYLLRMSARCLEPAVAMLFLLASAYLHRYWLVQIYLFVCACLSLWCMKMNGNVRLPPIAYLFPDLGPVEEPPATDQNILLASGHLDVDVG